MKRHVAIGAVALLLIGLMISSIALPAFPEEETDLGITVIESSLQPYSLTVRQTPQEIEQHRIAKPLGDPLFAYEGLQLHPSFGVAGSQYMAAYWDEMNENVVFTYTNEDGVYYDVGADYPSIKQWGGSRFFGTLLPNPFDSNGAAIYLFECTDPADFDTYTLVGWDWSDNGWSDILDIDIDCDNSQRDWEFGYFTLVASTTFGNGVSDGPFISYQTSADGYATISWYYVDDCLHADGVIDKESKKTYSVYDHEVGDSWELLLRTDRFDNWNASANLYTITGAGNLQYPAVSSFSNDMVIIAETDQNGNKDLICISGNPNFPQFSMVVEDAADERYPDVRHVDGETFVCTYFKDGSLYSIMTDDAGATWGTPTKIEDSVYTEYKGADISELGSSVMYEYNNGGDIDIWKANLEGATAPFIEIDSVSGGMGITATVTNTGTADATDVEWEIQITGGFLGLVDTLVTGTIDTIAIEEETSISSGIFLGLGPVSIEITVGEAQESVEATQLLFWSIV
jgi:hypothetical protein